MDYLYFDLRNRKKDEIVVVTCEVKKCDIDQDLIYAAAER
jgi:hypothetical protein